MNHKISQHGVGLVEVLVAVLLLSVAVLGFSALQIRAVSATDESLVRTKSMTLVRNLAEVMRAYPDAYVTVGGAGFTSVAPNTTNAASVVPTVQAIVTSIATDSVTVDTQTISVNSTNCVATTCNVNQLVARDTLLVKKIAAEEDIKVAVVTCPGTGGTTAAELLQQQMCIITAWNDTKALLDDTDVDACANNKGVYKTGSHCLISEAY